MPEWGDNFVGVTQVRVATRWMENTRRKVIGVPVNNLVIKVVGNMAADNKITILKFENKSGVLLHPNYWLAGVYYKDKNTKKAKI